MKPSRLIRWGVALLGAFSLVLVPPYLHSQRTRQLAADLSLAGGRAQIGTPLGKRLWMQWSGAGNGYGTVVELTGSAFDRQWLESRDDLADIPIAILIVKDTLLDGSDLARLVQNHPLETLEAPHVVACDEVAVALAQKSELRMVRLRGSDLTDDGLQRLPLEQLMCLDVSQTAVTAEGLKDLRRCAKLEILALDGRQFTADSINRMEAFRRPYTLRLVGTEITDDHLRMLFSCRMLRTLFLEQTSVSEAVLAELSSAVPACDVHLGPSGKNAGNAP